MDGLMDERSSLNIVWRQRRSRNYRRIANLEVPNPPRVPLEGLSLDVMQNGFQYQHGQEGMRWGSKQRRKEFIKDDLEQGEIVYRETVTQNNSPLAEQHGKEGIRWGSKKRRTIVNVEQILEGERANEEIRDQEIDAAESLLMLKTILEGERGNEEIRNQEIDAAESLLMLKTILEGERTNEEIGNQEQDAAETLLMLKIS